MDTIHLSLFMMLCLGVHRSSSEILQRRKRNWIIDSFSIDEGYNGRFPYSLGTVQIEKNLAFFKIRGQGVDLEPKDVLKINEDTGEITVHRSVDYEKYKVLKLTFQAMDRKKNVVDTQLGIEIKIADANDNPPKFDHEMYKISIRESKSQGTEVITLKGSDVDSKSNGIFDLQIVSVTPKPYDWLEFYLTQAAGTQTGTISFKGCLDHEKAEKYTIVVEAKDRGEKTQLSSSCTVIINIEDGNNHPPVIKGQTGPGRVKEGEENVLVSRLQVADNDTRGTAAWRVKYQIQGDTNNNFRITTDPETNEGLLYVEKQLDYEEGPLKNVTISVENEIPYHSCKVVNRRTTGLWEVVRISGATIGGGGAGAGAGGWAGAGAGGWAGTGSSTHRVTVTVEDVNEPPIFDKHTKQVTLRENVEGSQNLATFTARDPDVASANTFVYKKGYDPAGWVTVHPVTGTITTLKAVDRESPFVKDNIYKVTVYAVDNGKPPMTGTATLNIHITDDNDNVPYLAVSTIAMCQSNGSSLANITVMDLDEKPYGGPFRFKLLGDFKGKWKVDPGQGYSVNLTKENTVHSGHFELLLGVTDFQGETTVHNLSVTVCSCVNTAWPDCHIHKSNSAVGRGALGILFFSILLFAGMLLLAFLVSCKEHIYSKEIPDEGSGQHMMNCNTEKPGTDCKVAFESLNQEYNQNKEQIQTISQVYILPTKLKQSSIMPTTAAVPHAHSQHTMSQSEILQQRGNYLQQLITDSVSGASQACSEFQRDSSMEQRFTRGNYMHSSMGASSTMRTRHQHRNSMRGTWGGHTKYSAEQENGVIRHGILLKLNTMLYNLQTPGIELGDYAPHVYAEEEDTETCFDLDAISIPDISFDPDLDLDLDFKFNTLASICMPSESTAYSTKTSCVMERLETATLIQVESQKTKMNTQSYL